MRSVECRTVKMPRDGPLGYAAPMQLSEGGIGRFHSRGDGWKGRSIEAESAAWLQGSQNPSTRQELGKRWGFLRPDPSGDPSGSVRSRQEEARYDGAATWDYTIIPISSAGIEPRKGARWGI